MFEISPLNSFEFYKDTPLRFNDIYEAGNSVLKRRAETLGIPWESA